MRERRPLKSVAEIAARHNAAVEREEIERAAVEHIGRSRTPMDGTRLSVSERRAFLRVADAQGRAEREARLGHSRVVKAVRALARPRRTPVRSGRAATHPAIAGAYARAPASPARPASPKSPACPAPRALTKPLSASRCRTPVP